MVRAVCLVFPAWVVRQGARDLSVANVCAAFELDPLPELARLNEGSAYLLEVEFTCPFSPDGLLPIFQQTFVNDFPGYHPAGARSVVEVRHRWDCHGGSVRVLGGGRRAPDVAPSLVSPRLSTRFHGRRGELPWGAHAVWVDGEPVLPG